MVIFNSYVSLPEGIPFKKIAFQTIGFRVPRRCHSSLAEYSVWLWIDLGTAGWHVNGYSWNILSGWWFEPL